MSERQDPCRLVKRQRCSGVLIWERLTPSSTFRTSGRYSISFYLHSQVPFCLWDLAHFLLWFVRTHQPMSGISGNPISHFGYALQPDGIYGVIICGPPLEHHYWHDCLTTFWPENAFLPRAQLHILVAPCFAAWVHLSGFLIHLLDIAADCWDYLKMEFIAFLSATNCTLISRCPHCTQPSMNYYLSILLHSNVRALVAPQNVHWPQFFRISSEWEN